MAPSTGGRSTFKGLTVFVSVFNDDGTSACKHIEQLVREHGGSVAKRLSSATHLVWRNGDPKALVEAKEMRKKVSGSREKEEREGGVTKSATSPHRRSRLVLPLQQVALPSWIEVCIAAEEALSTKAFQPTEEPQAVAPILAPINGRRKSAAPRPLTGKRSLEPIKDQASHVPSPSHECFSSSQLELKDPGAREQARKRLRKSMGPAAAAAARRRSSAAAAVSE